MSQGYVRGTMSVIHIGIYIRQLILCNVESLIIKYTVIIFCIKLYEFSLKSYNTMYLVYYPLQSDKANLYNSLISETFSCIDAYTEIKFRQSYHAKVTSILYYFIVH